MLFLKPITVKFNFFWGVLQKPVNTFCSTLCTHVPWKELGQLFRSLKSWFCVLVYFSVKFLPWPKCPSMSISQLTPHLCFFCWLCSATLAPCCPTITQITCLHYCPLASYILSQISSRPGLPWLPYEHGTHTIHSLAPHSLYFIPLITIWHIIDSIHLCVLCLPLLKCKFHDSKGFAWFIKPLCLGKLLEIR